MTIKVYGKGQQRYFVRTGERRRPNRGEWYLGPGMLPRVYLARKDVREFYEIVRPATNDEIVCPTCKRPVPMELAVTEEDA